MPDKAITASTEAADPAAAQAANEAGLLAAIDIGSNSFHLIIARFDHGELRPVQTLGERAWSTRG